MRGKLIVFYGVNNLGKSTQLNLLLQSLKEKNIASEYVKYPLYKLEPFGPMINRYLRKGNPDNLTPREAQLLYILNRTQYQPTLEEKLNAGTWIIAEDYIGTGIAWGVGAGVSKDFLLESNSHLLQPDHSFLLYGQRFTSGIELIHKHEQDNELVDNVAAVHAELADEFSWIRIIANDTIEEVQKNIWSHLDRRKIT